MCGYFSWSTGHWKTLLKTRTEVQRQKMATAKNYPLSRRAPVFYVTFYFALCIRSGNIFHPRCQCPWHSAATTPEWSSFCRWSVRFLFFLYLSLLFSRGYVGYKMKPTCYKRLDIFMWYWIQYVFHPSNVVIEWLTLLLSIREIPGSNIGQDTGYLDQGLLWFSSVPPVKRQDRTLN
jgi:hypothetical protein